MLCSCLLFAKHLMGTWGRKGNHKAQRVIGCGRGGAMFCLGPLNLLVLHCRSVLLNMISCLLAPPLNVSCSDPNFYLTCLGCIHTGIHSCPLVTSDFQGLSAFA